MSIIEQVALNESSIMLLNILQKQKHYNCLQRLVEHKELTKVIKMPSWKDVYQETKWFN